MSFNYHDEEECYCYWKEPKDNKEPEKKRPYDCKEFYEFYCFWKKYYECFCKCEKKEPKDGKEPDDLKDIREAEYKEPKDGPEYKRPHDKCKEFYEFYCFWKKYYECFCKYECKDYECKPRDGKEPGKQPKDSYQ